MTYLQRKNNYQVTFVWNEVVVAIRDTSILQIPLNLIVVEVVMTLNNTIDTK